jgi:hypothetical protein
LSKGIDVNLAVLLQADALGIVVERFSQRTPFGTSFVSPRAGELVFSPDPK